MSTDVKWHLYRFVWSCGCEYVGMTKRSSWRRMSEIVQGISNPSLIAHMENEEPESRLNSSYQDRESALESRQRLIRHHAKRLYKRRDKSGHGVLLNILHNPYS